MHGFHLLLEWSEELSQGQGVLLPWCPSEKVPTVSRWARVLVALVGTNEDCGWIVGQWWETIATIALSRRT